jgi:hypothetical protein
MSTTTTNYGFVKPALSEEASAEVLTSNIQKASYVLNRIKQSTSSEYPKKSVFNAARSSALSGIPCNDTSWTPLAATWTTNYDLDNGDRGESGAIVWNTGGVFGIVQPGYYRVAYQVAINSGGTTHTRGSIRAGIFYWDDNLGVANALANTFTSTPCDTQAGITYLSFDSLIRVKEHNDTGKELFVHGPNNVATYDTNGTPDWTHELRVGQKNSGGANTTGSIVVNETWIELEFVRSL